MFAVLIHQLPFLNTSISAVGQIVRQGMTSIYMPNLNHDEQRYQVQIFSRDPLIIFIRDFLSSDEITRLLYLRYEVYIMSYMNMNGTFPANPDSHR